MEFGGYTFTEPMDLSSFRMEMRTGFAITDPRAQMKVIAITGDIEPPFPKFRVRQVKRKPHGRTNGPRKWKTIRTWR